MTHICVSKQTIIVSDNGLSPGRCQAIIWTNAGILLIGLLGINSSEILIEIYTFSKMHLKMSYGKWLPFCLGLNVLINNAYSFRAWRCCMGQGTWSLLAQLMLLSPVQPNRQQAIVWTNSDPVYWRINATVSLSELSKLTYWGLVTPYGDRDLGQQWFR